MRQEALPDPSDNIWQSVETQLTVVDKAREQLLLAASYFYVDPFPRYGKPLEVWRIVSATEFENLLNQAAQLNYSYLERARLMLGLFQREDNLRVYGLNQIADDDICTPISLPAFAARRLVQGVEVGGWEPHIKSIASDNRQGLDNDLRLVLGIRANREDY